MFNSDGVELPASKMSRAANAPVASSTDWTLVDSDQSEAAASSTRTVTPPAGPVTGPVSYGQPEQHCSRQNPIASPRRFPGEVALSTAIAKAEPATAAGRPPSQSNIFRRP